jgi:uncharacterized hydrophobic protein (TIGR00271 family)
MPKPSPEDVDQLCGELLQDAQLNLNVLALTISSCIIASLGLLMNSVAVIIGAMIIAPLILPLRGLAISLIEADLEGANESLNTVLYESLAAVAVSWLLGRIFALPASEFGTEILARTQPNLADLFVALTAGAISGFARIRPQISDALAGTAIAVALMPPLCVVGISLSQGAWRAGGGALLLYGTNLLGITLACMLVFAWGGYYADGKKVRRAFRWSSSILVLLIIPLFTSLTILLQQKQLRSTIKNVLENETITVGQQVVLQKMQVNWRVLPWHNTPSTVILDVQSEKPVTPKQVRAVEKFLKRRLKQDFRVIFRVSNIQEVTSDSPEQSTP